MNAASENAKFFWLTVLEIMINILTYFIGGACVYIVLKYPLLHRNFIRLVKCMVVYYIVSQIIRLLIALTEVFDQESVGIYNNTENYLIIQGNGCLTIFGYIRLFCLLAALVSMGTLIGERTFATIKIKTYETVLENGIFFRCFAYHIVLGCGGTYLIYSGLFSTMLSPSKLNVIERMTLLHVGAFVLIANFGGCLWLYMLEKFNKRRHRTSLLNPEMYCLSERFQLQENVKTSKMIRRVANVACFLNILIGGFICFTYYYSSDFIQRCSYMFFQYTISIYGLCFALMAISADPLWFQNFKKLIVPSTKIEVISCENTKQRKSLGRQLLTYNGKKMVFTVDEEREMYFKELKNRWN